MRVCILTTSYPRRRDDPAGGFVEALAVALARARGWQVRVVAPHDAAAERRETRAGVEIFRFRYAWPAGAEVLCYRGGIPTALKLRPWTAALLPGLLGGMLAGALEHAAGCDLIHCHWTITALAGLAAGAVHKLPVVVTTLGSDVSLAGRSGALASANRHVFRRADAVAVIGSHMRPAVRAAGCPERKIRHIPLGIGEQFLARPPAGEKSTDVLFVGRLTPEKRPALLLDALGRLIRAGRTVSAEFVGDGPLREALSERIRAQGLATVKILGRLPEHRQVVEAMDRARCLALVSSREGLPSVVLEAMARGLAVVACDVGSVGDLVRPGETGVLLPADAGPDLLAETLAALLDQPDRLAALGRSGRQFVRANFSWSRAAEQYDHRQVLTERARSG